MVIYKYNLKNLNSQVIAMPKGARILCAQQQLDDSCISMWVIVDPNAEMEQRTFEIIGTGNSFDSEGRDYISTVQMGIFVWHVFENKNH